MAEAKEKQLNIGVQDFKDLIAEIRKPVKSDKEIEIERQAEADRLQMRATMIEREKNRLAEQANCKHMQPKSGATACTYVYANGGPTDYLICQHCQKSIYPTTDAADAELFNTHLQKLND